jgi:hypothetical protein
MYMYEALIHTSPTGGAIFENRVSKLSGISQNSNTEDGDRPATRMDSEPSHRNK